MRKFFLLIGSAVAALLIANQSARFATAASCDGIPWRLTLGPLTSEATGQHTAAFVLTNPTKVACTLLGYPKIVLLDGRGGRLAFTYSHDGDQMITKHRPKAVRISAGGSAYFAFNKYRCDIRASAIARVTRVLLPGSHRWLQIRLHRYPIIDYCPAELPSRTIAVSPIVKTLREAAAR
jgi:Protein of unknown function (DUF4232)